MSLDTVLQIGKVLRNSENNLKYFKYVEPCPKDKNGDYPICITIPVKEDFSFDWSNVKLTPEKEQKNLYYLKFKTSDADTSPNKYFFGDIFYSCKTDIDNKTGKVKEAKKDFGNYTLIKGDAFTNAGKSYGKILEKCYCNYANSLLEDIQDVKQKQKKIKEIVKAVNNKTTETLSEQDDLFGKFMELVNSNSLIRFHSAFEKNLDKFKSILIYAPAFENILNETNNIATHFDNCKELENKYIGTVYQNVSDKVKKQLFGKQDKELSLNEILNILDDTKKQNILRYANFNVFIHFEFHKENSIIHWYQIKDAFDLLIEKLNSEITRKTDFGLVPNAYIYRTLCSGNSKNDIQFPDFELEKAYKSFVFNSDTFADFLYAGNILDKVRSEIIYQGKDKEILRFTKESFTANLYQEKDLLQVQLEFFKRIKDELNFALHSQNYPKIEFDFLKDIKECMFEKIGKFQLIDKQIFGEEINYYVPRNRNDSDFETLSSMQDDLIDLLKKKSDIPIIKQHKYKMKSHLKKMSNRVVQVRLKKNQTEPGHESKYFDLFKIDLNYYSFENGIDLKGGDQYL